MDEDEFEETRTAATIEDVGHGEHPPGRRQASTIAAPRKRVRRDFLGGAPEQPGIIWVRASDLLNSGSGRVAGRGLDFEAELARRMRRSAATTRRAIRERADRLPPLSAFGRSNVHPPFTRHDLGRR